jgi:hypothetical protein
MYDSLLSFCKWLQNTPLGLAVGGTLWGYPFVQLVHFFGLSLWVGTIAMLDLRLLGIAGRAQGLTEFSDQLFPWTWTGLAIVLTGGVMLFSAAAASYLDNPAFEIKFPLVLTGIAYHTFIVLKVPRWGRESALPRAAKIAGGVELLVWLSVITAAVMIPNF